MLRFVLLVALSICTVIVSSQHVAHPSNRSLLWGPYRPNLYLGFRPKIPDSLLMGLMWSNSDHASFNGVARNLRHSCDQDDGAVRYEWITYDPRKGGVQIINDTENHLDLITEYAKGPEVQAPGSWGLKVHGKPRSDATNRAQTTIVFYLAGENEASKIKCKNSEEGILCKGRTPGVGKFVVRLPGSSIRSRSSRKVSVYSLKIAPDSVWQAKAVFLNQLKKNKPNNGLIPNRPGLGNLHFIQLTLDGDIAFDMTFTSGRDADNVHPSSLISAVVDARNTFEFRFETAFTPATPFIDPNYVQFSKSLLSNLLASVGYFDGTMKINTEDLSPNTTDPAQSFWDETAASLAESHVKEDGPFKLFSAVPSRTTFARGFLFDEGFHLLTILDWDADMGVEMIDSWLNMMDEHGWIAREMILGPEGRNRVAPLFQAQNPHLSAPPTMFLAIQSLLQMVQDPSIYNGIPSRHLLSNDYAKSFFTQIYPKLKLHYTWFRQSHTGNLNKYSIPTSLFPEAYRWQFRSKEFTISSGVADYPRPEPPSMDELHVDALSWVGVMATTLESIAAYLGDITGQELFSKHQADVLRSLEKIHWSSADKTYCDTTVVKSRNTDKVQHVCHKGYNSLFPFLLGLLPPKHPHLGALLDTMRHPGDLWTSYGLRSLSPRDEYYAKGSNIYRGPVWVHMNYLALKQLLALAQQKGPHQKKAKEMYGELRVNIVRTVYESWKETGWVWEQYNPDTGLGQRTKGFVGWNSLLVKVMAMPDLGTSSSTGWGKSHGSQLSTGASRAGKADYSGGTHEIFVFVVGTSLLVASYVHRRRLVVLLSRLMRK